MCVCARARVCVCVGVYVCARVRMISHCGTCFVSLQTETFVCFVFSVGRHHQRRLDYWRRYRQRQKQDPEKYQRMRQAANARMRRYIARKKLEQERRTEDSNE